MHKKPICLVEFQPVLHDRLLHALASSPPSIPALPLRGQDRAAKAIEPIQPFERGPDGWSVSRWVGSISVDGMPVSIIPRIGEARFMRMLASALQAGVTHSSSVLSARQTRGMDDLLPLVWWLNWQDALRRNGLPKSYVERESMDCTELVDTLDLAAQLIGNHHRKHRLACRWTDLTLDNPINRGALRVLDHLRERQRFPFCGASGIQREALGWRERLGVSGVRVIPNPFVSTVRWSPANQRFQTAHALGKAILAETAMKDARSEHHAFGLLFDSAEVWEMYLLKRLQGLMSPGHELVWPRHGQADYLLRWQGRPVRGLIPDFEIRDRDSGTVLAILDAKYRHYAGLDPEIASQMALYAMRAQRDSGQPPAMGLIYPRVTGSTDDGSGINQHLPAAGCLGVGDYNLPGQPRLIAWTIELPQATDEDFEHKVERQLRTLLDALLH